ncbi:hypothetical protein CLU79DRAFT_755752 [Phycomyces nitens]|nr:hypothetical protein CLU79DRAFT_755752 [Phycomyces nitens]
MVAARSQDASRQQAKNEASHGPKINTVPFPRGGRHIGEIGVASPVPTSAIPLHRSNSVDPGLLPHVPKDKKRPLFGRFTKKKDSTPPPRGRAEFTNTPNHSAYMFLNSGSGISSISSISSTSSTYPLSHRKESNENDYRPDSLHPLDAYVTEETSRSMQRGPYYFNPTAHTERKRSGGSGGMRKGKDRERVDNNFYYSIDRVGGQRDGRTNEHHNYYSMEAAVNLDNYNHYIPILHNVSPHQQTGPLGSDPWAAPESWGVQPPSILTSNMSIMSGSNIMDNDPQEFDDTVVPSPSWDETQKKNLFIRIFRPDGTFSTLQGQLNTTTSELLQKLAGKIFLYDLSKHCLILKTNVGERILQPTERPLLIQTELLKKIGYTAEDIIEDVGRKNSTYFFSFIFDQRVQQQPQNDFGIQENVDLQAQNLPTIPIYLFGKAFWIISLNLSKNLLMEIPIDFAEDCSRLQSLSLVQCEYSTVLPSIPYFCNLRKLNMSINYLTTLENSQIEKIEGLMVLMVYSNRLTELPLSFVCFKHLTVLNVSNNDFTVFPAVICEITSLESLDISFNKITTIPDSIGDLVNLAILFIIANRIKGSLPPGFSGLKNLQELDIRQNSITDIDILSQLPILHTVSADYNSVGIVNCKLNNIRQLKMCKNHLTHFNLIKKTEDLSNEIPPTIGEQPTNQLTELNLSNCKLSSLPDELFLNITFLERLILDNNTLNSIPSSIGALQRLTHLSIHTNNLDSLPVEIAGLSELIVLDAQKNNLKTLPKEIWLCSSLKTLNCSSNLLESFPEPYSAPGVAFHLPLTPQAEAVVTPSVMANAASDGILPTQLGSNAGQGIVPMTPNGSPNEPVLPTFIVTDSSIDRQPVDPSLSPEIPTPNSALSQRPPNFNPPSFFASPRNHPPPLSLSLRTLLLGDNRLTDDVWSPLSLFLELRTLNLSFNDLYEIPPEGLCHQHLYELYLSGNNLTSLPADDIERLGFLRVLAVNGNKLQTLPAEIGKLKKLFILDVGNNVLKYNISNWPYDWNWNWNLGLKYLNLSGNKRLVIEKTLPDPNDANSKDLSNFNGLNSLHMLGLMDITILGVSVPEERDNCRVRTSPSEVNGMGYGVADWVAQCGFIETWDLVMPKFRNKDDECVFGLFDGKSISKDGCKITKLLNDTIIGCLSEELKKNTPDDTIVSAIRRTFLTMERELEKQRPKENFGASAVMCYISGTKLYVANVGDALAVISRNNGQAYEITQKHIPLNPGEILRIHAAGGYVSSLGKLNNELTVSRSFGHFNLIPVVNANPYVSTIQLTHADEFVIMASRGLWDRMSYQTAVDIARTEKDDFMAAAQKLRDFAISYGSEDNLMVMVIGVGDLFNKREKKVRNRNNIGPGRSADGTGMMDDGGMVSKSKRRGKEEGPGDSTLARLEKEVPPPVGLVALVFTDIKSSTQFWETQPENMRAAIKIHDAVMRRTLRSVGGYEVKTEGDAFMVCFQNITAALLWCFTVQLQLLEADWPAGLVAEGEGKTIMKNNVVIYKGLSVRMGIHWGKPVYERNPITNRMDYFGTVVNKASRISNAADGGQICVSSDVVAALRNFPGVFNSEGSLHSNELNGSVSLTGNHNVDRDLQHLQRLGFHIMTLGSRRLKGLETPELLSFVYPGQLAARMEISKSEILSPTPIGISVSSSSDLGSVSAATVANLQVNDDTDARRELNKRIEEATTSVSTSLPRTIDPMLICSVGNIALRLEQITSNSVLSKTRAGSTLNSVYTSEGLNSESHTVITNATTPYGQVLDKHIKEAATDEELVILLENYVSRVENAVSSLYLQKVGHFATVLEKLGDAIELDPTHILRALQMYAEVSGLSKTE